MFAKSSTTFVKVIDSPHRRRSSEVDRVVHRRFKQAPALFKNHPALNGCLERIYWSARAIQYRLCFEDKDGEFDSLIDTAAIEPNIKPPNMDILRKKTGYLFSEKWLKYSYQRFKSECPTGRMNLTDFKRLFGKFVPSERVSDGYLERLFSAFTGDLSVLENEDGEEEKSKAVLSFEGLVCALATLQSSSSESYAEWILKLMRKNPDERVSYKEFAEFVKSIYELSGKKVSKNLDLINYQASATFDELDVEREGLVGAVANVLVIVISKIKKDSGNQDVQSTFLHICGSSILICLCMTATMSQEIRYDTAVIKIPHGFLAKSSPNFLTGIYAIQTSSYTYILFNISIMFLNRLNVICNKNTMSTIFSSKNMKIFTALAVIISLIQAAFVVLTAVDTNFLWERLNKTTTAIDDLFEKQEMSASFLQNQQIQIANQKQIDADMGIVPVANSNTTTNFKEQNRNQVEATRSRISVYGTDNSINPIIWASDTLLIIIFMASYITIIICSILIRNSLTNKQENLSDKMRISQKGLHTALVSYSLIPFVLAIIYFANYIQGIINKQFAFDIQSYISTATIALNPPLLGMSIFAFIKFYRQAFTEIILRQKPVEPKKEEMNEVDVEESKNMTTSQMRGMIKQGQEASTIAMPQ